MKTITSRRNPLCVHLKKLGSSNSYRKQSGEFLCDGIKLLEDAVKGFADIPVVLTSADIPFPLSVNTKLFYTDKKLLNSLSPLKQSQDVLFSCKIPEMSTITDVKGTHILLEHLQDPGNVGTIIRTANAFGINTVMLFGDCADPYNPKTIRGSMGSIFRQDIRIVDSAALKTFKESGMKIIGAALSDDCRDFTEVSYENTIIAIGNEGSGLSDDILALCDEKIMIPISKDSESLNAAVAAAIIMQKARCNYVCT